MKPLKTMGLALAIAMLAAPAQAAPPADWAHFGGDMGDTKYSPSTR